MSDKPHWVKTSTAKGSRFMCSKCRGTCICLHFGANKKMCRCDYKYCPRCGDEMNLEGMTVLKLVEEQA